MSEEKPEKTVCWIEVMADAAEKDREWNANVKKHWNFVTGT